MADQPVEPYRIIVPYTKKIAEVVKAIDAAAEVAGVKAEWVDVSSDDEAYYRLLHEMWKCGQTFIVCEHDMVPHPYMFKELGECPYGWCAFPYMVVGKIQTALGLTKFHRVLTRDRPHIMDEEDRYWAHQDVVISMGLMATGIGQHVHMPPLDHLNPRASLGRRRHKSDVNVVEVIADAIQADDFPMDRPDANRLAKRVYDRLRMDSATILSLMQGAGLKLERIAGAKFYPVGEEPDPTERVKVTAPLDLGETEFVWMGMSPAWELEDHLQEKIISEEQSVVGSPQDGVGESAGGKGHLA